MGWINNLKAGKNVSKHSNGFRYFYIKYLEHFLWSLEGVLSVAPTEFS